MVVAETGVGIRGTNTGMVYPEMYHKDHSAPEYASAHATVTVPTECWGDSFEDVLGKLCASLKINIVGESYRQYFDAPKGRPKYPLGVPKGRTTIERALEAIVMSNAWWKRGNVYMIQHPLWWIDRLDEVSDTAVERLRELANRDVLRIEDWGEIGSLLTKRQWPILNMLARDRDFLFAMEHQPLLRFYGSLGQLQSSTIFTPAGLDVSRLRLEDKDRLYTWLKEAGVVTLRGDLEPANATLRVSAERTRAPEARGPVLFRVLSCSEDGSTRALHQQFAPSSPRTRLVSGNGSEASKRPDH